MNWDRQNHLCKEPGQFHVTSLPSSLVVIEGLFCAFRKLGPSVIFLNKVTTAFLRPRNVKLVCNFVVICRKHCFELFKFISFLGFLHFELFYL